MSRARPEAARDTEINQETHASANGGLFGGWKIWIAQRVPQRTVYISKILEHGGQIVPLEQSADVMIADHMRRDAPPETFSYTWIEQCIANQEIVSKELHRAGPPAASTDVRPTGSYRPTKSGRNPFTAEDDRVLYKWVVDHEKQGAMILGNEIYKQLERINNRHPWQSWRDRWVKYVSKKPPQMSVSQETPPTPPSDDNAVARQQDQDLRSAAPSSTVPEAPQSELRTFQEPPQGTPVQSRVASTAQPRPLQKIVITPPVSSDKSLRSRPVQRSSEGSSLNASLRPSDTPGAINQVAAEHSSPEINSSASPYQVQRGVSSGSSSGRRATKRTFTIDEHELLAKNVVNIQASMVENYVKMWDDARIFNLDRHSPEEWREYYETKILPHWTKLSSQEKHKRLSDVYQEHGSQESLDIFRGLQNVPFTEEHETPQQEPAEATSIQDNPSSSTSQKRRRDVIEISDQEGKPQDSTKRRRQKAPAGHSPISSPTTAAKSKKPHVSFTDAVQPNPDEYSPEGIEQQPLNPNADQETDPTDFNVFEDRNPPEEEKENIVLDNAGSYSLPPRHVHVKSSDALEAFSEPLPKFTLQSPFEDEEEDEDVVPFPVSASNTVSVDGNNDSALGLALQEEVEQSNENYASGSLDQHQISSQGFESQIIRDTESQMDNLTRSSHHIEIEDNDNDNVDDDDDNNDGEEEEEEEEEAAFEMMPAGIESRRERRGSSDVQVVEEMIVQEDVDSDENEEASRAFLDRFYAGYNNRAEAGIAPDSIIDAASEDEVVEEAAEEEGSITQDALPEPPSLFVSSPPGLQAARVHPTVSYITVREEVRPSHSPASAVAAVAASAAQPLPLSRSTSSTPSRNPHPQTPQSHPRSQSQSQSQSQPQSQPTPQSGLSALDSFIAEQLQTQTHTEPTILYALQRANLDIDVARSVLAFLARGRALPKGVRGIWVEADDELLQSGTPAALRRLEAVHGKESVDLRRQVLESWGEA